MIRKDHTITIREVMQKDLQLFYCSVHNTSDKKKLGKKKIYFWTFSTNLDHLESDLVMTGQKDCSLHFVYGKLEHRWVGWSRW